MFFINQFINSLVGIIAYRTAGTTIGLVESVGNKFINGLNLYRCPVCYRLYKDDPVECRCGKTKLIPIRRKIEDYNDRYRKKTKARKAFQRRYGVDHKDKVRRF